MITSCLSNRSNIVSSVDQSFIPSRLKKVFNIIAPSDYLFRSRTIIPSTISNFPSIKKQFNQPPDILLF